MASYFRTRASAAAKLKRETAFFEGNGQIREPENSEKREADARKQPLESVILALHVRIWLASERPNCLPTTGGNLCAYSTSSQE
jgi:hypothetical protein